MAECLFCRIAAHALPAEVVYEDDAIMAFRDINPQAPVHLLLIPKQHLESVATLTQATAALIGKLHLVARELAEKEGLTDGYRLVTNCGLAAGQSVPHLHYHLLGGRELTWPPG